MAGTSRNEALKNRLVGGILRERWSDSRKVVSNGRLAWFSGAMDGHAWNDHWHAIDAKRMLEAARWGSYPHRKVYHRYFDKTKPILEGGCGVGHIVLGLQTDGYDVIGVEQTREMVDFVKAIAPDCNIAVGDILRLSDFPDGYLGGYISLGVVEHFSQGPQTALREANRVLCIGGALVITVPYFNIWRRFKARYGLYPKPESALDPADFYQYAFTKREFVALLKEHGFRIEDTDHVGAPGGIGREFWALGRLLRRTALTRKALGVAERVSLLRHVFGHSALFVARKVGQAAE